jgi:hypothetical protein
VTLRRIGIQAKFFIPHPTDSRGSFRCSDSALNEIWHLGRYAVELCSVPASSIPPQLTVTPQGVKVPGNQYAGYQGGATWTDYTASFDVQVLNNEAAWLVRGTEFNGVRLVLAADNDVLGISKPGSWHQVRNEVVGNTADRRHWNLGSYAPVLNLCARIPGRLNRAIQQLPTPRRKNRHVAAAEI